MAFVRDTVTTALPILLNALAVIVDSPPLTAVTRPVSDTDAMAGYRDRHVMARPVRMLPTLSLVTARSSAV